jgi:hypothetical protein
MTANKTPRQAFIPLFLRGPLFQVGLVIYNKVFFLKKKKL